MQIERIKLDPRQINKAAEVSAASFFNYPMFTFYFPDPQRRTRNLPWYFKNILNTALRYGEVYTTPEVSGVIFTLLHAKVVACYHRRGLKPPGSVHGSPRSSPANL